jgi:hypothetical protein
VTPAGSDTRTHAPVPGRHWPASSHPARGFKNSPIPGCNIMQRKIEIRVPSERTEALLAELQELDGLVGLNVQRGASLEPKGDVITAVVSNRSLHDLARRLDRHQVGSTSASAFGTSDLKSVISPSTAAQIGRETSDLTWEEMESVIGKEANMTGNAIMVMAIAGVLATVGIATNAVHLVIGAMAIAPGFAPIQRIPLGIVARGGAWRRGLSHTAIAYAALIAGAAAAALLLRGIGTDPLGGGSGYLEPGSLTAYWTSVTPASLLASLVAATAGAILISSDRSVLTAGVMIALALIPTAALIGIGLATGSSDVARDAALRWALEVGLVFGAGLLVLLWKRNRLQDRDTTL